MIEAVVVVFSLKSNDLLTTGHFAPPREFVAVKDCQEWLETEEGSRQWHELGEGFREVYNSPVDVVPACLKRNEA
jgi:hypothetical protein